MLDLEEALDGAVLVHERHPDLRQRRGLLRDPSPAGDERVPPLPDRPRRRRAGLRGGRRGRRGDVPDGGRAARGDGAARLPGALGAASGWSSGPGRIRRSTCARTSPASSVCPRSRSGSSARRWAARSAPRRSSTSRRSPPRSRARPAGRYGIVLPRARGVGDEQPPSRAASASAVGARRDGTLVAKHVDSSIDTGAYADCGPGVAVKIGYSAVGPYRIPNVARRLPLRLHEPAAQRRLPRLRRHAGRVGVRAGAWTCSPSGSAWIRSSSG